LTELSYVRDRSLSRSESYIRDLSLSYSGGGGGEEEEEEEEEEESRRSKILAISEISLVLSPSA